MILVYMPILLLMSLLFLQTYIYASFLVDEHFVIPIPENLSIDAVAPLLCAGVTVYSPLRHYGLDKPGIHVGVVGLGGLGHLAVKFAKAMGVKVTVISTSPDKKKEAIEFGADSFFISKDLDQMQAAMGTLDGIIDTVSAPHPLLPLMGLLKSHSNLILTGVPDKPLELPVLPMILGRKAVVGSMIGGIKETKEMVKFAAKHDIKPDIEVIPVEMVSSS